MDVGEVVGGATGWVIVPVEERSCVTVMAARVDATSPNASIERITASVLDAILSAIVWFPLGV